MVVDKHKYINPQNTEDQLSHDLDRVQLFQHCQLSLFRQ